MTRVRLTALVLLGLLIAVATSSATPPTGYGTPIAVVPGYGNTPVYQTTQTGLVSSADFKQLLDVQKQMLAEIRELRAVNVAMANKMGAPLPQARDKKGPDIYTVLKQHCAGCHKPGTTQKTDFLLFADPDEKLLRIFSVKDLNNIILRTGEETMPPGSRKKLTPAEKAVFGG